MSHNHWPGRDIRAITLDKSERGTARFRIELGSHGAVYELTVARVGRILEDVKGDDRYLLKPWEHCLLGRRYDLDGGDRSPEGSTGKDASGVVRWSDLRMAKVDREWLALSIDYSCSVRVPLRVFADLMRRHYITGCDVVTLDEDFLAWMYPDPSEVYEDLYNLGTALPLHDGD